MNELKMGFTYDVTHIAPNGEEVEHQKVHNVMMNLGLTKFLNSVFNSESTDSSFVYGLMETSYQPSASDTIDSGAFDLYGWDSRLLFGWDNRDDCPFIVYNSDAAKPIVLNNDGVSVSLPEKSIPFVGYKVITGCFLLHDFNGGINHDYPSQHWTNIALRSDNCLILSAATFETPMQIEPNGILKIKAGFSAVSA